MSHRLAAVYAKDYYVAVSSGRNTPDPLLGLSPGDALNGIFDPNVSHSGTAGHSVRRIDEFAYPWPKDGVLIQHTDGLGTHWDVDRYPGLLGRSPSLIAAVLYRDFNRGRDDVTVLVASEARA